MTTRRLLLAAILMVVPIGLPQSASLTSPAEAARISIYGLESVRIDNVYDPTVRPERLRLVSGSLKLTGRNKWEMVSYIPRRTAAPRSDYGVYRTTGNRLAFYSLLTFSTYYGLIDAQAGRIQITKINKSGQSQREVWYIVR